MAVIEIENLEKYYGNFHAVKGVNFSVNKSEIVGLLGPNGAGKSTTIRILCGYLKPNGGRIAIQGKSPIDESGETKKMVGYLPESAPLYGDMLVYDYLEYVADIRRVQNKEMRIREVASQCGLREKMHAGISELSKGYRQRVGLAHAMIGNPDILILDEPTSGLDPNQIVEIRELIREIGREKTVILSTHILSEVEATCDRVIIINEGRIVADNAMQKLKSQEGMEEELTLELAEADIDEVKTALTEIAAIRRVEGEANGSQIRVTVFADGEEDVRPTLYRKVKSKDWILLSMNKKEISLENIFRSLTKESYQ